MPTQRLRHNAWLWTLALLGLVLIVPQGIAWLFPGSGVAEVATVVFGLSLAAGLAIGILARPREIQPAGLVYQKPFYRAGSLLCMAWVARTIYISGFTPTDLAIALSLGLLGLIQGGLIGRYAKAVTAW